MARGQHRSTPAGDDIAPGQAAGEHSLGAAIDEIHKQHPHTQIAHTDDRGPYHRTDSHDRHIPVIRKNGGAYSR
jgi:hypothetical protein